MDTRSLMLATAATFGCVSPPITPNHCLPTPAPGATCYPTEGSQRTPELAQPNQWRRLPDLTLNGMTLRIFTETGLTLPGNFLTELQMAFIRASQIIPAQTRSIPVYIHSSLSRNGEEIGGQVNPNGELHLDGSFLGMGIPSLKLVTHEMIHALLGANLIRRLDGGSLLFLEEGLATARGEFSEPGDHVMMQQRIATTSWNQNLTATISAQSPLTYRLTKTGNQINMTTSDGYVTLTPQSPCAFGLETTSFIQRHIGAVCVSADMFGTNSGTLYFLGYGALFGVELSCGLTFPSTLFQVQLGGQRVTLAPNAPLQTHYEIQSGDRGGITRESYRTAACFWETMRSRYGLEAFNALIAWIAEERAQPSCRRIHVLGSFASILTRVTRRTVTITELEQILDAYHIPHDHFGTIQTLPLCQ